jgi:hypothetical protein
MHFKILSLLLIAFNSMGQEICYNDVHINIRYKSGFLAAHRGTVGHLPDEPVHAIEIGIETRLENNAFWNDAFKNPFAGAKLYHSNLSNKEVLGTATGLYGFMEFPWFKSKRFFITSSLGAGFGYISKKYDPVLNPKNPIISTNVCGMVVLGLQGKAYFNKHFGLTFGADLTHFSNGGWKLPNLGANLPFITVGLLLKVGSVERKKIDQRSFVRSPFFSNWKCTVMGILSGKEIWPSGNKRYPVYATSLFLHKQMKQKTGMEIALDLISKQSLFGYRNYIPKTQWSIFQIGTYLGFQLPLNKLRFVTGMGVYLKDRYDADDEFYHRLGMRYQLNNGIMLNFVLKSHWAKADYLEWGIGYTFNHKKRFLK